MKKLNRILKLLAFILVLPFFLFQSNLYGQDQAAPGGYEQPRQISYKSSLDGLVLNLVYTQNRYNDALRIADILRNKGVQVKFTKTASGNSNYDGKILYKTGHYYRAKLISTLIKNYENVVPQLGTPKFYRDKQFNLWVTTNKFAALNNLRGLITNIVYTQDRFADAIKVGSMLRRKGVIVKYTKTTAGNSYVGKILYRNGYYGQASQIASMVNRYEKVRPQLGTPKFYRDKHFNLWITSPKSYNSYNNNNYANLNGLVVNIVYVDSRFMDSRTVGNMLRKRGMRVKYTRTSNGNAFKNKILYRAGYLNAAKYIKGLVKNYETVYPQYGTQSGYKDKHFNLWITSTKYNKPNFTNLRGLIVNIVYTDYRYADAMDVGNLLRRRGMRVKFTKTGNGNAFAGKILYRQGYSRTARYIANLIRRFELVKPQFGTQSGYKDKHFNLWITM